MESRHKTTIGLVNAPNLADGLREAGYSVITDPQFRKAASLVQTAIKDNRIDYVVVGGTKVIGLRPWVASTAIHMPGAVFVVETEDSALEGVDATYVSSLSELIEALSSVSGSVSPSTSSFNQTDTTALESHSSHESAPDTRVTAQSPRTSSYDPWEVEEEDTSSPAQARIDEWDEDGSQNDMTGEKSAVSEVPANPTSREASPTHETAPELVSVPTNSFDPWEADEEQTPTSSVLSESPSDTHEDTEGLPSAADWLKNSSDNDAPPPVEHTTPYEEPARSPELSGFPTEELTVVTESTPTPNTSAPNTSGWSNSMSHNPHFQTSNPHLSSGENWQNPEPTQPAAAGQGWANQMPQQPQHQPGQHQQNWDTQGIPQDGHNGGWPGQYGAPAGHGGSGHMGHSAPAPHQSNPHLNHAPNQEHGTPGPGWDTPSDQLGHSVGHPGTEPVGHPGTPGWDTVGHSGTPDVGQYGAQNSAHDWATPPHPGTPGMGQPGTGNPGTGWDTQAHPQQGQTPVQNPVQNPAQGFHQTPPFHDQQNGWAVSPPMEYSQPTSMDFDSMYATQSHMGQTQFGKSHGLAPVIVSWAGKGGVGKTSIAICLAQVAAQAGLRVTLVDANRGQKGVGVRMRIDREQLPSIYNAVTSGDLRAGFVTPDQARNVRAVSNLEELKFALVQAPPPEVADPEVVTNELYGRMIRLARETSDVVIVDTQIAEAAAHMKGTIFNDVLIPLLRGGAWGVGIMANNREGAELIFERLKEFNQLGVSREHMLVVVNKWDPDQLNPESAGRMMRNYGTFVGAIEEDAQVEAAFNSGGTASNIPSFRTMMNAILSRVTGDDTLFNQALHVPSTQNQSPPTKKKKKKFGLFGRKKEA